MERSWRLFCNRNGLHTVAGMHGSVFAGCVSQAKPSRDSRSKKEAPKNVLSKSRSCHSAVVLYDRGCCSSWSGAENELTTGGPAVVGVGQAAGGVQGVGGGL